MVCNVTQSNLIIKNSILRGTATTELSKNCPLIQLFGNSEQSLADPERISHEQAIEKAWAEYVRNSCCVYVCMGGFGLVKFDTKYMYYMCQVYYEK